MRRARRICEGREQSATVRPEAAREAYADLKPIIVQRREEGASLQAVADELNGQGHTTRRGKKWNAVQIMRVLGRV